MPDTRVCRHVGPGAVNKACASTSAQRVTEQRLAGLGVDDGQPGSVGAD